MMDSSMLPSFLVPLLLLQVIIHSGDIAGHASFTVHALPPSSSFCAGGSSDRCGRPTAAAFTSPLWSSRRPAREALSRARLPRLRGARPMVVNMSSSSGGGGTVGGGTQRRPQSDPSPVGFPPSPPAGGVVNGATSTSSSAVPPAASPLVAPPPPPPVPAAVSSASSSTVGGGVGIVDGDDEEDPPLKHTPLGKWEYLHGNYVLRPSSMRKSGDEASYLDSGRPEMRRPRALLHFLGGALVGAAPQLSYRYVLERLAENNYLVVATPFSLSFNHMGTCDEILGKFERVAPMLAREYGAIPVIGVGHSLGALLQVLISSLFPDTPRAGNIIMSYNNKDVREAVPLFDEVWTPFFVSLADDGEGILGPMMSLANGTTVSTNTTTSGGAVGRVDEEVRRRRSSVEGLNLALRVARTVTQGTLPSDKLLNDVRSYLTPPFLSSRSNPPPPVGIPEGIRDAVMSNIVTPQANLLTDRIAVLPLLDQCLDVADQIPRLIDEVAGGARDFDPPPSAVATAARRAYRARRTLLVQYEDDPLDETEVLEAYLRESEQIMRMKRPMVSNMEVRRVLLDGMGHATPCIAPPVEVAETAENVLGKEGASDALLYKKVDETVDEMVRWLEEAQL